MHYLLHSLTAKFLSANGAAIALLLSELLALIVTPSILIKRRGQPLSALSWLLAVFSVPYIGVFLWWLIGRLHIRRMYRAKKFRSNLALDLSEMDSSKNLLKGIIGADFSGLLGNGFFEPTKENQVDIFQSNPKVFEDIEKAIESAKKEVLLLFYIWKTDKTGKSLRDLLIKKSGEGVSVHVLVDSFGSLEFLRNFATPMKRAGIKISNFLPLRFSPWSPTFNFRNHRKLIIIDEELSFTGGINIGNEYRDQWRDVIVRLSGPVVSQLKAVFLDDWAFATKRHIQIKNNNSVKKLGSDTCMVVASGPDCKINCAHSLLFQLLSIAKKEILIETPYFIPSEPISSALQAAVMRGVDVRLILPSKSDAPLVSLASRTYYSELLEAGVKIYEYLPSMLHSKITLIDDQYVLIGSTNIDIRSFRLNFELSCLVKSQAANQKSKIMFEEDIKSSQPVTLEKLRKASKYSQLRDSFLHLLSPLL